MARKMNDYTAKVLMESSTVDWNAKLQLETELGIKSLDYLGNLYKSENKTNYDEYGASFHVRNRVYSYFIYVNPDTNKIENSLCWIQVERRIEDNYGIDYETLDEVYNFPIHLIYFS